MKYVVIPTRWLLGQRFEITNESDARLLSAERPFGRLGTKLTVRDSSGREVASIRKRRNGTGRDVYVDDELVAHVQKRGYESLNYRITDCKGITGDGNFGGGKFTLTRDDMEVATTEREGRIKIRFLVDIEDGQDQLLLLAIILGMASDFLSADRS